MLPVFSRLELFFVCQRSLLLWGGGRSLVSTYTKGSKFTQCMEALSITFQGSLFPSTESETSVPLVMYYPKIFPFAVDPSTLLSAVSGSRKRKEMGSSIHNTSHFC